MKLSIKELHIFFTMTTIRTNYYFKTTLVSWQHGSVTYKLQEPEEK
jgi:hypothetical protein